MTGKRIYIAIIAVAMSACMFAACNSSAPQEPEARELVAYPPEQPATPTPAPTPEKPEQEQFTIVVKNAFLFRAGKDPFTRNLTREKGICLLAAGSVRNNTDRLCHRAGLFGTLKAGFNDDVTITKHTGGMGFDPEVSSENPWRPGTWRDFELVTRSLDPIYIEYHPTSLDAEITLEVRDPLNFTLRETMTRFKLPWRSLQGCPTAGAAAILEKVRPLTGASKQQQSYQPGDLVNVRFQKGGGYKVSANGDEGGWVPFDALALDLEDFRLLPDSKRPVSAESDEQRWTLREFTAKPGPDNLTYYLATFDIENLREKSGLAVRKNDFRIDFGPEQEEKGGLNLVENGENKSISVTTVKAGETARFEFAVESEQSKPLEILWRFGARQQLYLPIR
jgi:hypothetical protein